MLQKPPPMASRPKPQNASKYFEFYEQNGYTTTECRELRKVLHELADKGQTGRSLKHRPRAFKKGKGKTHDGQTINQIRTVRLPLRFRDKVKSRNVKADFLVMDVPTIYNVILGRMTLHPGPTSTKRPRMEDSTLAEALIIYVMATEDLKRPRPEPSSDVES
ncbi:hypothetical protein Cgig2_008321 [Carnegiea gigantea]|uniref:Uncharacterized protein n=1 Tax=Carnegiea gigantea TaxID=171969 RepID=A0A9Q1JU53_9CARY|nr:hypothetical protein Cgig2_008321 [Carnegiea gigantea]